MSKTDQLFEDEIGSSTIWELVESVADGIRSPELQHETVRDVTYDTAMELLTSRFDDFISIAEHPTSQTNVLRHYDLPRGQIPR